MSHLIANIAPELIEEITCEPPHETHGALAQREIDRAFTIRAPCLRDEIFADDSSIASICRSGRTLAAIRQHSHSRCVAKTLPPRPLAGPIVAWILLPYGSQSRLDCVTHDNFGKPHPIPLCKTRNVRPVLGRAIECRTPSSTYSASSKTLGADDRFYKPDGTSCDRLIMRRCYPLWIFRRVTRLS